MKLVLYKLQKKKTYLNKQCRRLAENQTVLSPDRDILLSQKFSSIQGGESKTPTTYETELFVALANV